MSETRKRAWFQLHLSTLLLLTFAAAGMLWANVRVVEDIREFYLPAKSIEPVPPRTPRKAKAFRGRQGWPFAIRQEKEFGPEAAVVGITSPMSPMDADFQIAGVFKNLLVALGILIALAVPLEWLARRKPRVE
ncbi:MAG: hypothetical protein M5U26_27580 [Planctomycetota bacterium]|nr:hypothetical protein [Planctomycetota bacterium]